MLGISAAHAAKATCSDDPAAAVAQAKAALSSADTAKDRAALVCLTDAVAALNGRIVAIEAQLKTAKPKNTETDRLIAPSFDAHGKPLR